MHVPPTPSNENARLDTLHALHILDTLPEERFERLTRLARRLFSVPIALVSLVDADRQWFKSCVGLNASETSRDVSFCAHAILGDEILTVPNGSKLGTLCLIDTKPRGLDEEERELLRDLARMAEQELAAVQLATLDDLTLLSNRRGFEALARHALNVCKRMHKPASLLFFDLNDFKQINDTLGHAEGDRALQTFADVLRTALRESDVIGRLGGDEFVVLLSDSDRGATQEVTQRPRSCWTRAMPKRSVAMRSAIASGRFNTILPGTDRSPNCWPPPTPRCTATNRRRRRAPRISTERGIITHRRSPCGATLSLERCHD